MAVAIVCLGAKVPSLLFKTRDLSFKVKQATVWKLDHARLAASAAAGAAAVRNQKDYSA